MKAELQEAEWIQVNFIEEERLKASFDIQCYHRRMGRAYDKKVKPRNFRKCDMVLKKTLPYKDTAAESQTQL